MSIPADEDLAALAGIPAPAARRIALHVTPEAERALRQGHPWLFDRAIRRQSHEGQPGDLAVIFDRKDRFLAVGLYDPRSSLRVRILAQGEPVAIDRGWFTERVAAAEEVRAALRERGASAGGIPPTPLNKGGEIIPPTPLSKGGNDIPPAPLGKGGNDIPPARLGKGGEIIPPTPLNKGGNDIPPAPLGKGGEIIPPTSLDKGGKIIPPGLLGKGGTERTTGYRVVHGENDGMPGLVIDRYERTYVCKIYTAAWVPHLRDVLAALVTVTRVERIVLRLGRGMQRQSGDLYGLSDGQVLMGPPLEGAVLFRENGLQFEVDPVRGQKTGFFLDQRDNRARVEKLAAGKTVLNLFAYTGGFSVYAARGGARRVVSVDSSAPALEAARRNWERNRQLPGVAAATHETVTADAFDCLSRLAREGRRFGLVIVDPPAFAQEAAQVPQALAAYERLTRLALEVLSPGGTLVQASCSSRVDADTFFATIHRAAARAGRPLREIERSGHALDHPIAFKEGAYLKCLFAVAQ